MPPLRRNSRSEGGKRRAGVKPRRSARGLSDYIRPLRLRRAVAGDQPRRKSRSKRVQTNERREAVVRHLPRSSFCPQRNREGGVLSRQVPDLPSNVLLQRIASLKAG